MNKTVSGIRLAATAAGIKYRNRDDLVLIECAASSSIAGVFTQNTCRAAPVEIAHMHLTERDASQPTYLLINSGNANAATGELGIADARATCDALAAAAQVPYANILPFSTGVVGEPLPTAPIVRAVPELIDALSTNNWDTAAQAIMTTDTVPKCVSKSIVLAGEIITITGIAKGSGMIQPNMATMLAYIATNATLDNDTCQQLLQQAVAESFNAISVDGDTSTNDACMLIATNRTRAKIKLNDKSAQAFVDALNQVTLALALSIVKDGEGATKFVTVRVQQAEHNTQARNVAFGIANSPLVKTALFACDPNWGRIIVAIGNHIGTTSQQPTINITINDYHVVTNTVRSPEYVEAHAQAAMLPHDIVLDVTLGLGNSSFTCYTCDFSHEYITINAEYRS